VEAYTKNLLDEFDQKATHVLKEFRSKLNTIVTEANERINDLEFRVEQDVDRAQLHWKQLTRKHERTRTANGKPVFPPL
jgi:ElaB/YqjD/DUF883 family membrane-anchored ribosome-binding protein